MSFKLAMHIIEMSKALGVNKNGYIIGTNYQIDNKSWYDGEQLEIKRSGLVIIDYSSVYGAIACIYLNRLKNKAINTYELNRINKIIEDDAIKYLSGESEIQEAIDDYKIITEHKAEIIKISKKWNNRMVRGFEFTN